MVSLAGLIPFVTAGCSGGQVESQVATITVEDGHFSKCNARIDEEGRVVWENNTDTTHHLTSASSNWSLDTELEPDAGTQKQFDQKDVYTAAVSKEGASTENKMKIAVGGASFDGKIDSC